MKPNLSLVSILSALFTTTGCSNQVAALKLSKAIHHGTPETCYGVVRAGQNDCKTGVNICAGWSKHDSDRGAFIYVPRGTCERISGGALAAQPAGSKT